MKSTPGECGKARAMTLEELKQAMDDAKAKAGTSPDNKELAAEALKAEQAYNAAVEEAGSPGGDGEEPDESKLDEKTKKYLAKLRKENATHRTKAKDLKSKFEDSEAKRKAILKAAGIDDDTAPPEERLKASEKEKQNLAFRNAILESAVSNGIPNDRLKYYQFLISEAVSELEEGEELSEGKLAEIVSEAKKGGSKGAANSTVGAGGTGNGNPNPSGGEDKITLEKFCSMSILQKSALYEKNRDLYAALVAEAKAKKKLV
jgi:hypothetical protein